jgi:hypothetical protein
MSKKRFVQAVVARSLPHAEKLPEAVAYAERLWDGLNAHGYGDDKPATPRDSRDYYGGLSDRQRAWFDRFWKAFQLKKGRNGAAMRWVQLGNLADVEYDHIVKAAAQEAAKQLPPGQARKEAQGWLFERRFDDYAPDETSQKRQKNNALRLLQNELQHLLKLYDNGKNPALKPQIEQLERRIGDAQPEMADG